MVDNPHFTSHQNQPSSFREISQVVGVRVRVRGFKHFVEAGPRSLKPSAKERNMAAVCCIDVAGQGKERKRIAYSYKYCAVLPCVTAGRCDTVISVQFLERREP